MDISPESNSVSFFLVLFIFTVTYCCYLVLSRIYFSPLSHIPGPKIAIATSWYECYYDVWKRGLYHKRVKEFHQQYGPIVRINPHEVHIEDSEFYDQLYNNTQKWDKYWLYVHQFNSPGATISTIEHDLHRIRRKPTNNFFSKRSIVSLEPLIHQNIEKLCGRLVQAKQTGTPFQLNSALLCYTSDVISEYAFGKSYELLDSDDMGKRLMAAYKVTGEASHTLKQFPWLVHLFNILPNSWIANISPGFGLLLETQNLARRQVKRICADVEAGKSGQGSIFHTLLESDLPPQDKQPERLAKEAFVIAAAGGDTTAITIASILYHLIANPTTLELLQQELASISSKGQGNFTWTELENLPYITAVVKEGLRLSHGVSSRIARCPADRDLHYKNIVIPQGTPVSMSNPDVHLDPNIFPEPTNFKPERWLSTTSEAEEHLSRYLVAFCKGSRQCLGMNLAYAEIYLLLATLVTRFDFELFETTRDDVEFVHDFTLPHPKLNTKYVQVLIR